MDEGKKDFREFFRQPDDDQNMKEHSSEQESQAQVEQEKDSLSSVEESGSEKNENKDSYYSYGPYRSQSNADDASNAEDNMQNDSSDVVVESKPNRSFAYNESQFARHSTGGWEFKKKKKGLGFLPIFSAFMAGVLVVGSLMFVSDRYNMFSGGSMTASTPASTSHTSGNSGKGGSNGNNSLVNDQLNSVVRPNDISQIVKKASPAVVLVSSYVNQRTQQQSSPFSDPFFQQFFGGQQQQPQQKQQQNNNSQGNLVEQGFGSGFIFDKSGYILTNEHVVDGAAQVKVTVEGYSKPFVAKVVGKSFNMDLAVLKIDGNSNFSTLPIDTNVSSNLNVGDWVVAIGNPYGFDHTVTVGVLSATGRPLDIPDGGKTRHYSNLLQTDAAINPGNSGGPLLNLEGQVVGINTAINSQAQGIGFAISSSTISSVLSELKTGKEIPKPFIGVTVSDVPQSWVKRLGLQSTDGAIVQTVPYGTPAYKAGIRPYDVITGVDGSNVKSSSDLVSKLQNKKVGDSVALSIVRAGKSKKVNVTLGDENKYNQLSNN